MLVTTGDGEVQIVVSGDARGFVYLGCTLSGRGVTQVPKLTPEEARALAAELTKCADAQDTK